MKTYIFEVLTEKVTYIVRVDAKNNNQALSIAKSMHPKGFLILIN